MIEIKPLSETSFEKIHGAFAKSFEDYVEPFDLTKDQLKYMVERRGCNYELSFGAFDGDKLVGLTLNGIGQWNEKPTAYDTGTGIIKEYRRKGIAARMFNESLPVLRSSNIDQYLLEVIQTNTAAVDLYTKMGFRITREFDYYEIWKDNIKTQDAETKDIENDDEIEIKKIETPNWELFNSFWEFVPSWQNSIASINRKLNHFEILGVFNNRVLSGYGIIEKHTGVIPQLAISAHYRRKGLAAKLFYSLLNQTNSDKIKIINTEAGYKPFKRFAEKHGLPPGHGQYEMILKF